MELERANRIIAEFMGWHKQCTDEFPNAWNSEHGLRAVWHSIEKEQPFCSLDTLVPVWEKLNRNADFEIVVTRMSDKSHYDFRFLTGSWGMPDYFSSDILAQAAAIATAKAIKELER